MVERIVQSKLEQLVDVLEVFMVVPCEEWHSPVHLKLLPLVHTCMFQLSSVMLFKATGSDLILCSSQRFTSGPSPHPIISHWRFFSWLIPLLKKAVTMVYQSTTLYSVTLHQTVLFVVMAVRTYTSRDWRMTVDSLKPHIIIIQQPWCPSLMSSAYNSWVPLPSHSQHITAESLSLTFSTYNSWVPLPSHSQHITAESLSVTFSTYNSWVPLPSHSQHITAESLYPHILDIWQLSPSTLTFSTYYSWVPLPSRSQHITAEFLYPHILDIWQLSPSTLTFSTYDSWVPLPSHSQHMTAESLYPHILNI